jgi:hypothetical protein
MRRYDGLALSIGMLCGFSTPAFSQSVEIQSLQMGENPCEGRSVFSVLGQECKDLSKACVDEQIRIGGQSGGSCQQYRQQCRAK